MIDTARRQQSVAFGLERRRDSRGDQTCGRLEQLQFETIGIGPHAGWPRGGDAEAGTLHGARHARPVVDRGQHAVVANRRLPLTRSPDCDIADLSIGGQVTEQHEVAQRVAHGLLMQRGLEDPGVESSRSRRVGDDDVEVLQAQVVEWKRLSSCALCEHSNPERGGHHRCENRSFHPSLQETFTGARALNSYHPADLANANTLDPAGRPKIRQEGVGPGAGAQIRP